jgi:hypothetical protein
MQDLKFRDIDEFMAFLPEDELVIVTYLRTLVNDAIQNCREKLSYNVPYYSLNRNICFIWPASVTWGKRKSYEGVRFGFTSGYLLTDEIDYLDKGERKQVYWKDFISIEAIDADLLKSYIFEAVELDRQQRKK